MPVDAVARQQGQFHAAMASKGWFQPKVWENQARRVSSPTHVENEVPLFWSVAFRFALGRFCGFCVGVASRFSGAAAFGAARVRFQSVPRGSPRPVSVLLHERRFLGATWWLLARVSLGSSLHVGFDLPCAELASSTSRFRDQGRTLFDRSRVILFDLS